MDFITFRCSSCKQGLKVGADKAGRKIKCTKCATELTVPRAATEEPKAPDPPLAPPPVEEEDEWAEGDKKGYGLLLDPKAEEEEKKKREEAAKPKKKVKPQKTGPAPKKKYKTIQDADLWAKVKTGLQIIMVGINIWAAAFLFLMIMVVLGIFNGPEYATIVERSMTVKTQTPAGEVVSPHMPTMMFGLVTGTSYQGVGKTMYIIAVVLSILQGVVLIAGYGMCSQIPDKFGTKGQTFALMGLGGFNLLMILIFKLLPALGVMNYLLVPYALPEISLISANIDRDRPIWLFWSGAPFWEIMLSVVLTLAYYLEPVLIGIFIWSIGLSLREPDVVERGQGMVFLPFGICFIMVAYLLLSMGGTSDVALIVQRVTYCLWVFFTILLLVRLPLTLLATNAVLQKYLDVAAGVAEPEEEDEDEDKPRAKDKKKSRKDEDEDEDDEDEDDDDEDEDEDEEDEDDG